MHGKPPSFFYNFFGCNLLARISRGHWRLKYGLSRIVARGLFPNLYRRDCIKRCEFVDQDLKIDVFLEASVFLAYKFFSKKKV